MLSGTFAEPRFEADLEWKEPVLAGRGLERIVARADGDLDLVDWAVEATVDEATAAAAEGRFDLGEMLVDGSWSVDLERLDG